MVRTIIGLILVIIGFTGLGALGWYFVKEQILHKQEYRLSSERIVVPPSPGWVPENFVEEILQRSGLNKTGYLLDKKLPQQLQEAFSSSPWVETVERVELRYPSGAAIFLSYRQPVALVEMNTLIPVDRNGILLPPEYLTNTVSDQINTHLLIQGIQSKPLGSSGTNWGDPLVHTAARLAAELADSFSRLGLVAIVPAMEATPSGASRIVCRIKTAGDVEIHWGTFDADDTATEKKKKKLWELQEQFRSLNNVPVNFRDLSRE